MSLNELVAIAEQTYSDKQRTISNPFGSGRIGLYFNDLLMGYRAKKAIINKELTVGYEFGIKGASVDLRYNTKYDEVFIVLTVWFTSLSHIMRIMSIDHAKLFVSLLERQIEIAQGLS
ncbi:hypothetical protein [Microvirga sp. 2TAF3]|uniref:hypothetical protein n=1 Tax=Microvirga sp. 2TAF3 TaxID=3233014 RepID=UPI003F9A7771